MPSAQRHHDPERRPGNQSTRSPTLSLSLYIYIYVLYIYIYICTYLSVNLGNAVAIPLSQ